MPPDIDPNALTEAELAYAQSGGDTEKLEKPVQAQEADEDDEPKLDGKTGRPTERGKWVSKKALDAERNQRERLSQELAGTKEQWARLEERFKVFQEALNAPDPQEEVEEPEEELPDPEQDIIGFNKKLASRMDRRFEQMQQIVGGLNDRLGDFGQQNEAQRQQNDLVTRYRADASSYMQRQPDFTDAYKFLMTSRDTELQAAGYSDQLERNRIITADEQALAQRAFQDRVSPAERLYALAKARGYQQATPAPAALPNGNGAAAPPASSASAPRGAPTAAEEIARLQAGQNAAMSLSNAGGNRPGSLGIQDLIDMPMDEFRSWARKNPNLLEAMAGRGQ